VGRSLAIRASIAWATCLLAIGVMTSCDPFGLPSTRALENGAASMLTAARSFEVAGTYRNGDQVASFDMQLVKGPPALRHLSVASGGETVEAIIAGQEAYYRGREFLARHLTDPSTHSVVEAAGSAWWKGAATLLPTLPDLTDGRSFRTAFLGPAVSTRTDHVAVDGMDTVELSGVRADVFVESSAPYRLVRFRAHPDVVVDGIAAADLRYSRVDADFGIAAPADVIDFSNLSTLPPIYSVTAVDTSRCGSPCAVSASLINLGGAKGARAPSSVTFTMRDPASGRVLGTCTTTVQPDVGYDQATRASCTIGVAATNAAVVTAVAENPGHG
jgi:hypothetical protein